LPPAAKEQNPIGFALMVALLVAMYDILLQRSRRSDDSPNKIRLDRHSSLTDLTQRFACEFRFGTDRVFREESHLDANRGSTP
jgi:hypothetical protein